MFRVPFKNYMKFKGVKESIKEIKNRTKEQKRLSNGPRFGDLLEESMSLIIEEGGIMKVEKLPPQYDMGFGADFKFSYKKNSKNYSFFVDVTSRTEDQMKYFGLHGQLVTDLEDAFCYYTEEFKAYFSIKYNHYGFFFYEKPVISLVVREFGPGIDLDRVDVAHGTNMSNIMVALHEFLCEQGYGARASHYVLPNTRRFYGDYLQSKGGDSDV